MPYEKQITVGEVATRYLRYLEFERPQPFSIQSLRSYRFRLRTLTVLWDGKDIRDITKEDLNDFRAGLIAKKCSLRYVHTYLCTFRSLLGYCEDELGLEVLSKQKIKLPPRIRQKVIHISLENLGKLIAAADVNTILGLRFMAFISTFLDTGLRSTEALSLNRSNIPWETKRTVIMGKGGKERMVFFRDWSLYWLRAYFNRREDNCEAAFVTHHGEEAKRVSYQAMRKEFCYLSKKAGIPTIRAHDLRRTGATDLRANGADVHAIQKWLGHEKIQTTEIYLGTNWSSVEKEITEHQSYGSLEVMRLGEEKAKTWSKTGKWVACIACRGSERPHLAKGYCDRCYIGLWRKKKRLNPVFTLTGKESVVSVAEYATTNLKETQVLHALTSSV